MAELHPVDQVVVAFFEAPRSYTAEDVVEISCHGSPVVLRHAVERALEAGARLAEPGEFTLRAFLNGRIDLPQAEAIRDLIEATTLYQARIAAQQAGGSVSRRIAPLKEQLLELIALLEAGIDFAEDDVSVATAGEILRRLEPVLEGVGRLAASFQYGGLVRAGLTLAIVGRPNVGKSSLFNRLLEQDRAIVASAPGTTRDLVSETASIGGIPVKLYDTAGIREGAELVESLGIERSFQAMADADLTLVVVDVSQPLDDEDRALIARADRQGRHLVAGNKCDLLAGERHRANAGQWADAFVCQRGWPISVSALTGEGIAQLREAILEALAPKALSSRRPVSSPACATSNCCANRPGTSKRRAPRSKPAFPTRCCCWISTPLSGPSTPSPAPPPRTTSSTASSPRSASGNEPMNTENDRRIDYIEFPCTDTARVKQVYGAVFGWEFKDYGPGYTSFHDGRLAGGFTTDARPAADGVWLCFTPPTWQPWRPRCAPPAAALCARHSHFPAAAASTSPTPRATYWPSGPSDVARARAREFAESQPGGPTNEAHGAFAVLPERAMAR